MDKLTGLRAFPKVLELAELDASDQAVTHLQATPRGLMRINAPMSFGTLQLGPAIADFMERYPELRIQLVLSDAQVDPVQDGLDVTLRCLSLQMPSTMDGCKRVSPTTARLSLLSTQFTRPHSIPL